MVGKSQKLNIKFNFDLTCDITSQDKSNMLRNNSKDISLEDSIKDGDSRTERLDTSQVLKIIYSIAQAYFSPIIHSTNQHICIFYSLHHFASIDHLL